MHPLFLLALFNVSFGSPIKKRKMLLAIFFTVVGVSRFNARAPFGLESERYGQMTKGLEYGSSLLVMVCVVRKKQKDLQWRIAP